MGSRTLEMLRVLSRVTAVGAVGCAGGGGWYYYQQNRPPPVESSLQPGKSLTCKVLEIENLTTDTRRFRFQLPTSEHVLGLPTASHIVAVDNAMDFRGPITTLQYEPNQATCLGMVAGGTGITPMYQIIRTVLSNPTDKTQLRLLYASR